MFDNFFASIAGKFVSSKLKLQEGPPMPSKPWYESKTIWSDVVTVLLSILGLVDKYVTGGHIVSSPFYSMALTFLGAMGIYGRTTATTTVSS